MMFAALLLWLYDAAQDKASARELLRANPLDPKVEELLQNAISGNAGDAEAHYLYGQWALLNHQEAVAIREETKAAALSPGNPLALNQSWTLVGIAEDLLDHESKARVAFEKARLANRKLPHPDANTLYEYAKFLQKRGHEQEAGTLAARVLEINPTLAPAHLLRAKLLESGGDSHAAISEAEKALENAAVPDDQRAAHAFLARVYFASGDSERAQPHREWIEQHGSAPQ